MACTLPCVSVRRTARANTSDQDQLIQIGESYSVAARSAAAYDLLAYRTAFAPILNNSEAPYGLGVAWGADLAPRGEHGIVLCTPDTLDQAVCDLLD
jgi:hypothetical protein